MESSVQVVEMSTKDLSAGVTLSDKESDSDDLDSFACDPEDQDIDNHDDYTIHPVLLNDIQLMMESCRNGTLNYSCLNEIEEMDLEISLPTALLEKIVAEAWGLSYDEPIVINLIVDQHYYLDTDVKRIEVFQKRHSSKQSVLMQLKMIVEQFCKKQICELTNERVKTAIEESSANCGNGACFIDKSAQQIIPPLHKAKDIPSLRKGFLMQLYLYIEQRLLTLNSFCPICDSVHSLALGVMLKPVICSSPLCAFSYETLGVMADAVSEIVSFPELANLLILLTKAAVKSVRRKVILSPYPTVAHPCKIHEMAMHPGTKDFELLTVVLEKMPDVQEMLMYDQAEFMKILNERHELCHPLLRWIISSNRSHIVKLPFQMQLVFMGTQHQFFMCSSPPLKEREFRIHREKYGSIFAFHGSPIENWHSIVRNGLIVGSGTEFMIHGARAGTGIYLSPHLGTSIGYCHNFDTDWYFNPVKGVSSNYIQGKPETLTCIALCEVIDSPTLKKMGDNIWMCDDSDHVCTRFFFVYDECNICGYAYFNTETTTPAIHEQLKLAIAGNMVK